MPDSEPIKVTAQRLTPEEEAQAQRTPMRKVRAEPRDPVDPREVTRAQRRGFAVGVALTAGAAVAAAVTWFVWGRRSPSRRNRA